MLDIATKKEQDSKRRKESFEHYKKFAEMGDVSGINLVGDGYRN